MFVLTFILFCVLVIAIARWKLDLIAHCTTYNIAQHCALALVLLLLTLCIPRNVVLQYACLPRHHVDK